MIKEGTVDQESSSTASTSINMFGGSSDSDFNDMAAIEQS
jgi:hypothetical protein